MNVNYTRQLSLLDPGTIKNKSVTVIGAGATGSYVALMIAQMGWGNTSLNQGILNVWDFDVVEEHNLANQAFERDHIGKKKVDALKDLIIRKCGFEIVTHDEAVVDQRELIESTYVFILTDTMKSRKEIFEKCLKYSFKTDLVIETRMDIDNGRVYAINPNDITQIEGWEKTLYTDEEAETSLCGASASIVPTVYNIASRAVWLLLHHYDVKYGNNFAKKKGKSEKVVNETIFSLPECSNPDKEIFTSLSRDFAVA